MYLSRLILNPRSRRVQRELAEPYEMHRSLMRAFSSGLAAREERILFRVDDHPRRGLELLVQSWETPDWTWLEEAGAQGYLRLTEQANPAVKPFDFRPAAGQVLAFRLRANPTRRLGRGAAEGAGRRVGIYREDDQIAWLERKAQQHGFRVVQASVNSGSKAENQGAIHRAHASHDLKLLSVQFDGVLQVTDPDKLVAAVENGIGSGKGFGFGLLSLARWRET
jgi:CRISPR system Cascade subunit CasE